MMWVTSEPVVQRRRLGLEGHWGALARFSEVKGRAGVVSVVLALCVLVVATYSHAAVAQTRPVSSHAVGVLTVTFVDHSRATPANGDQPELPYRTLATTIWYPARGNGTTSAPVQGAAPDRSGGPYPLIVFAHGLGATPQSYAALLGRWAAAGYVVAAPRFPLTSTNAPGGLNPGDVFNQPGDLSYVITSVLQASAESNGTLSGLVDPHEIGVAGPGQVDLRELGLDRPRVHPLLPVGVVAVMDLERDRAAQGAAVPDPARDLGLVALAEVGGQVSAEGRVGEQVDDCFGVPPGQRF